ncbi:hypothetical protein ES332_D11G241900v1, partial [Gossypium tomentosum]
SLSLKPILHQENFPKKISKAAKRRRGLKLRSRVMSTERTILSPFTKEYRVLVTLSGIRQFLEGHSLLTAPIPILVSKRLGFLVASVL